MPSQLKQLKLTLRDSGLSRTSQPKDAKKRAKQRRQLSSGSAQHRSAKLDAIGKDFNKFDVREENQKFQVVTRQGRLEQGKKGTPGKSRAAGVELRKKTLLPMLESRSHTSTFLDHRFGENSASMTPEEKALVRFTAERQSRIGNSGVNKRSKYNLEDGDDDDDDGGETLTHGGRKLGFGDEEELEAGGWGGLGDGVAGSASSSNREPLLRRKVTAAADDAENEPSKHRSKAEIMEEVMLKSKAYKYERQKIRSADDETRIALDAELKDLRAMLSGGGVNPKPSDASTSNLQYKVQANDPSSKEKAEEVTEPGYEDSDDESGSGEDTLSNLSGANTDASSDSGGEKSTYELNDEELEAALAASGKSGVDRDLLRRLIGSKATEIEDEEDEAEGKVANERRHAGDPTSNFVIGDGVRPEPSKLEQVDYDQYDQFVRQLALEPRAHASNRMKTALELAKEAADELRQHEEARLRRQRGEKDEDSGDDAVKGQKGRKQSKRVPQADDLEDDYLMMQDLDGDLRGEDSVEGLGHGLEGGQGKNNATGDIPYNLNDASGESAEQSDDEEAASLDEELSDDDDEMVGDIEDYDSEDGNDYDDHEALVSAVTVEYPKRSNLDNEVSVPELPYTFPCPLSHQEFIKLLERSGTSGVKTATVAKRIRTLYHPSLAASNKEKLQVFTNVLLDHILHLAARPSDDTFATINALLPHLLTLSHAFPLTTAPHYVEKLSLMQKNFVRGLTRGALDPSSRTWPSTQELILLRIVGILWSTSDLSHPVAAPAMLLICHYLAQARVRNLQDIACGLFLCTVASQYETFSNRLIPECMNFLTSSLLILTPNKLTPKNAPGDFPIPDFKQNHTEGICLKCVDDIQPSKLNIRSYLTGQVLKNQNKVDLIAALLALLKDLTEKYVSLDASIEIFSSTQVVLSKIDMKLVPESIRARIKEVDSSIRTLTKFASQSRRNLLLQQHKPIPIATYIPKFDEGFNPNSKFDPDTERSEANKVRSLYKKEKKGAIRELRKDNKFLAGVETKKKAEADAAYTKKIAKIMGSLQDERAEEKSFQKTKERLKRQDKARSSRK